MRGPPGGASRSSSFFPALVLPNSARPTTVWRRGWPGISPSCGSSRLNGVLYVAYTAWSGEWRHLVPNRQTFREAWEVVRHDLGLRKAPLPRRKFNGAQQFAYTGVVAMGAGSLLNGSGHLQARSTRLAHDDTWRASKRGGPKTFRLDARIRRNSSSSTSRRWSEPAGTTSGRWSSALRWRRTRRSLMSSPQDETPPPDVRPSPQESASSCLKPQTWESQLRRLLAEGSPWGERRRLVGVAGLRWVVTRSDEHGLPWPSRRVLGFNERAPSGASRGSRRAHQFLRTSARLPRVNGQIGIDPAIESGRGRRLRVVGGAARRDARESFVLDEIRGLCRGWRITTELRVIEGWSNGR